MSEESRAALCRGTMTSGIDLAQVAAARARLAELSEELPAPVVNTDPVVSVRVCVLAGLLAGSLVWLIR
tara:strand:+ start:230 stop:436 length:207 start_codon:yes stop_codon:yes gene_type:complete